MAEENLTYLEAKINDRSLYSEVLKISIPFQGLETHNEKEFPPLQNLKGPREPKFHTSLSQTN